jgi:hypothetical protein
MGEGFGRKAPLPPHASGTKLLATLRTLHPLKIHPLDQIRRDRESALRQVVFSDALTFSRSIFRDRGISSSRILNRFHPRFGTVNASRASRILRWTS